MLRRCPGSVRATLLLDNGVAVRGCGWGPEGAFVGELVFTTGMTGYERAFTDPSFAGQILVWTHPMLGCYGVSCSDGFESDRIQIAGLVASEIPRPGRTGSRSLLDWLREQGTPTIYGVDTRALVKLLRERGVMKAALAIHTDEIDLERLRKALLFAPSYEEVNYGEAVSPREVIVHERPGSPKVSVLDCGLKNSIVRRLLEAGLEVHRYPCSSGPQELVEGYDGVVLSNGPGNPAVMRRQIETVKKVLGERPVLGICLGMQLAALAMGASVYKLKYGHRGTNKGVIDSSGKSYITSQNHGYAIEEHSLEGTGFEVWFRNVDDGTIEGLVHEELNAIFTQFHPEGGPGPRDTSWIFKEFARRVGSWRA